MNKTVTTPAGTVLPLTNLKGKQYLMVAYRLQWLNESLPNFTIDTDFLLLTEDQTVARAKVVLYDKEGKFLKSATATKRETKKDFSDHTEKAETSAVGRALALLGYGTQFALADLEEGERLADSPLADISNKEEVKVKKASFRKPTTQVAAVNIPTETATAQQTPHSEWE